MKKYHEKAAIAFNDYLVNFRLVYVLIATLPEVDFRFVATNKTIPFYLIYICKYAMFKYIDIEVSYAL